MVHTVVYQPVKEKQSGAWLHVSEWPTLEGPDFTRSWIGIIIRFKQEPIGIMADVEAMFHQVQESDDDTDLLRFLWWPGGDYCQALTEHKMTVPMFGATFSHGCASFALRKCPEDQSQQFSDGVIEQS